MKSFEAIVVRVSRPFAYNKDGMVNSCIKMLVDVKNVGKRVLTFIPEKEYSNYSFTRLSPTDNLKELSPFVFASLCERATGCVSGSRQMRKKIGGLTTLMRWRT